MDGVPPVADCPDDVPCCISLPFVVGTELKNLVFIAIAPLEVSDYASGVNRGSSLRRNRRLKNMTDYPLSFSIRSRGTHVKSPGARRCGEGASRCASSCLACSFSGAWRVRAGRVATAVAGDGTAPHLQHACLLVDRDGRRMT